MHAASDGIYHVQLRGTRYPYPPVYSLFKEMFRSAERAPEARALFV